MKALKKQEVAIEILKSQCQDVANAAEAEVIVGLLESILKDYNNEYVSISAPETNVLKKVAIIRTKELNLNLVNPKIVEGSGALVSFQEPCISFPDNSFNCLRHESIIIENGFSRDLIKFKGYPALIVQHEIDHLNGIIFHDRKIKFALVRSGGIIYQKDFCPCGSKKRFGLCCQKK